MRGNTHVVLDLHSRWKNKGWKEYQLDGATISTKASFFEVAVTLVLAEENSCGSYHNDTQRWLRTTGSSPNTIKKRRVRAEPQGTDPGVSKGREAAHVAG